MKSVRMLSLENSYKYRRDFLMKKTEVLVETERDSGTGLLKGYDDKYIRILLKGPEVYKSRMIPVRIKKVDTERTFGTILCAIS